MTYLMCSFLIGLVFGLIAVASNPAPYFAALGLVLVAAAGCGILVIYGGAFLSLVLFLIYLGGMLVVFAYTAALAAEPYPEGWGTRAVAFYTVVYMGFALGLCYFLQGGWCDSSWVTVDELEDFSLFQGDIGGVAMMYHFGGYMLIISAWALLLTLFAVLELTRGLGRGALRAI
uniref:NADH-ubiquinone oxidoreductase chain 6 n=1 Tax=Draconetta xenica TaxID=215391 RepID=A0A060NQ35_9TELE|nr:NADH dehydrogenase subunit 6 [Draconetta xenica]BAO84691.1 NADH dehydrogenase subunit 6 [Draconetta xenica]